MEENKTTEKETHQIEYIITDQSQSVGKIALALSKAQGNMKGAAMNAKGHFNNKFADLHNVIESCKPHLSSHEIAFVQGNRFKDGVFLVVTKLIHSSGEWLSSEMALPIPKNAGPQQIGSLNSYGRRYTLASMAGIAQYDDDATEAQGLNNKVQRVNK